MHTHKHPNMHTHTQAQQESERCRQSLLARVNSLAEQAGVGKLAGRHGMSAGRKTTLMPSWDTLMCVLLLFVKDLVCLMCRMLLK